jgi:hypothetical protein
MTVRVFDQVNRMGVRSTVTLDPDHKRPLIGMAQDCAPILEQNRREQNEWQRAHQNNPIRARKIASIPWVVWQQFQQIGVVEGMRVVDEAGFLALLSDPDLRALRCDNGGRLA